MQAVDDQGKTPKPQSGLQQDLLQLTPTARLARARQHWYASQQTAAGRSAWLRPSILHYPAWLQLLRQQAVLCGGVDRVLIDAGQARWLWQQVIDSDVFVGEPKVAQLAEHAWQQLHEHCLADPEQWPQLELSDDTRAFRQWAWRFRQRCNANGWIDTVTLDARLPALIAAGRLDLPARIELVGFELPATPLQQAIFSAAEQAGVQLMHGAMTWAAFMSMQRDAVPSARAELAQTAQRLQLRRFADADAELQAAASWARQQLDANPQQSLAVVVPDLSARLEQVDNHFRQVFDAPAFALQATGQPCWHVSLGKSLPRWPLVSDALLLLGLEPDCIDQPRIGRVLRSPFVAGWLDESAQRHACIVDMLRKDSYEIRSERCVQRLQEAGSPRLAACFEAWQQQQRLQTGKLLPSVWAGLFQQTLQVFGFAAGRKLDSIEYQLLQRWHRLLETFSALDVVASGPVDRAQALALLNDCAASSTFRERNPGCPVEILGIAEALGARFDAIWITTLDTDTWPQPARREALLPGAVQGLLPTASNAACLRLATLQLCGLLRCADSVQGSLANSNDSERRELTALLQQAALFDVQPEPEPSLLTLEVLTDDIQAAPLADVADDDHVPGGTAMVRNQSACPFRAFAVHRLQARELRPPRPGLNAMQRGELLHRSLELFWQQLPDQAALLAQDAQALAARIRRVSGQALQQLLHAQPLLLSEVGERLELTCLQRALSRWLELEQARPPFAVKTREQRVTMQQAGLRCQGKIDRIDVTAHGELLIDYKSGRVNKSDWFPQPRMADPQLPMYALAMDPPPQGIAFASLAPDQMGFDGLAAADMGIDGVIRIGGKSSKFRDHSDWSALLQDWAGHVQALAADFRAGKAAVDPRRPEVCQYCHLHALCRIHERSASLHEAEASAS